jgi:mRNA interferase RelE/StbE
MREAKVSIKSLEIDLFKSRPHSDIKQLKRTKKRVDLYRLRVVDYRVIYALEENTIFVLEIIPRKEDTTGFETEFRFQNCAS